MPRFEMADNSKAQKHVAGSTVVVGAWMYTTKDNVDYLMIVDAFGEGCMAATWTCSSSQAMSTDCKGSAPGQQVRS